MDQERTDIDVEAARGRSLLLRILRVMIGLAILAFVASRFDPTNELVVGLLFYGPTVAVLAVFHEIARRGHVKVAAWCLATFFWALIASVTVFFGGLVGQNTSIFAVSVVLAGTLVGGRAALGFAVVSSLWVWLLVYLHASGSLPAPLSPVSPVNGAIAVTTTLVLLWALVWTTIRSLRELNERAAEAARLRDEALRRSIDTQKLQVVGTLASGIAHDFNNLLAVIGSAAEVLRSDARRGQASSAEVLDDVDAATMRASLMTRQLLSFGRPHAGAPVPVDVGEAVRALEPMLPRLLGSSIEVEVKTSSGSIALATRAGLEQILLNLAVNARDAMPVGGRLSITVSIDGDHVLLRVEDSGTGMDEEAQRRAFEPFFTTKRTGTGLGLATVRDLVRRYDGEITLASTLGAGTTFEIRLPRRPGAEPSPPTLPPRPANAPARLLLVEDHALVRRSFQRTFEAAGFDVVSVSDGLEALGLLERTADFAVVVSDISMPGLDGVALAKKLAETRPTLPVVLVSGDRSPPTDVLAFPRRAFVEKPAPAEVILAAIAKVREAP